MTISPDDLAADALAATKGARMVSSDTVNHVLAALTAERDALNAQLLATEEDLGDTEAEVWAAEAEARALQAELATARQACAAYCAAYDRAIADKHQLEAEVYRLKGNEAAYDTNIEAWQAHVEALETRAAYAEASGAEFFADAMAFKEELHRWQHGTQDVGDYVCEGMAMALRVDHLQSLVRELVEALCAWVDDDYDSVQHTDIVNLIARARAALEDK